MNNELNEMDNKMNVIPINVPEDVEYISEWESFTLPLGHSILDKTICGCGFTEYCLNNNIPTVLCSPRKKLLENKEEQHNSEEGRMKGLKWIYYFRNDYENNIEFDGNNDINTPFGKSSSNYLSAIQTQENIDEIKENERINYLRKIKDQLREYVEYCKNNNLPFKIIVTYDSLYHILNVLSEFYRSSEFYCIVDEFQSIFVDSSFKATVELDFVEDLKLCENVLYLSATPMLERYLIQLDEFKDLPMYKLIWDDSRIERVRIEFRVVRSINNAISKLVEDYRNGKGKEKVLSDGTIKYSKELVIFVNSIKSITDIIKKCDLKPEETNIVCADNSKNIKALRKVGHKVGKIPTEGQHHKMFTICTRTTYLGADFYSTNAYTVVCSDCNIQTMTVDISLDLPQILGRQRLKENVFRNEALLLYKAETKKMAIINEEKLVNDEKVREKEEKTLEMLKGYETLTDIQKKLCAEKWARDDKLYEKDYIGVSKRTGQATFNFLVKIADQRAYEVSRREYIDKITIKRGIESIGSADVSVDEKNYITEDIQSFREEFNRDGVFVRRMKMLCDCYFADPEFFINHDKTLQTIIPREYQNYINLLGFERIRALKYQELDLKREISTTRSLKENFITTFFTIGSKYSKKQIKDGLKKYYEENNIIKTPKATDLEEYFDLKTCKVKINDKWENGFEIISKKVD